MKRIVCVFLIAVILCSFNICFADNQTDCRGAFEFTELYIKRLTEYKASYANVEVDINIIPSELIVTANNTGVISVTAGTMEIDLTDYSLVGLTLILQDADADNSENRQYQAKAITAIAALEYSDADDAFLKMTSEKNISDTLKGSIGEASAIMREIQTQWKDGALNTAIQTGDPVLVYSGNYDYYIAYVDDSNGATGRRVVFLDVEARK